MATSDRYSNIIKALPVNDIGHYYKKGLDYGIIDVLLYPFDYADTLIRLGYEPFPPIQRSHIFEPATLNLPGLTKFVYYLYQIDGFTGIFRSVVPYVTSSLIYRHLLTYASNRAPFSLEVPESEPPLCAEFTRENVFTFLKVRAWRLLSSITVLHVSYPFYVIAVRTIARFVTSITTKEGYRPGIDDSWLFEILKIKGFGELYAGMQARVLREVVFAGVSAGSFLAFMYLLQVIQVDTRQAEPIERSIEYIGNSIGVTYSNPYRNVGDIMIINGTDIPLGNPPFMNQFETCWECILGLRKDHKWKTSGGGLFTGRRYSGPRETSGGGKLSPSGTFFGPVYFPLDAHGFRDSPWLLSDFYDAWSKLGVKPGANMQELADIFMKHTSGQDFGMIGGTTPMLSSIVPSASLFVQNIMSNAHLRMFNNPFLL